VRRASVDMGSLYLRLFLGAKPFESPGLDSLAGRMSALQLLSVDPKERYFTTRAGVAALSFGNKLLFGARYYERLTENQRLAAGAHEFAHMLGRDGRSAKRRVVLPSLVVSVLLMSATFLGTGSALLAEVATLTGLLATLSISSRLNAGPFQKQELRCDSVAASFIAGQELIAAIEIGESLARPKPRKRRAFNAVAKGHPTLQERIETIGRVEASKGSRTEAAPAEDGLS